MTELRFQSPFYRVLAVLLDYPGEGFTEMLAEAEEFLRSQPHPWPTFVEQTMAAVKWMRDQNTLDLQQIYVETFDFTPQNSLHLTSHLLEEQDRHRGPALIKLAEHYSAVGLRIAEGELPDYLPAVLEFASTTENVQAARFLAEADQALGVLEKNLHSVGSPYAPLIAAARQAAQSHGACPPAVAAGANS